jgi:hypothetical protein
MNNKPLQSKLLITVQRPFLWLLSFIGLVSLVTLMVWVSFEYGLKVAGYDKAEAMTYIDDLQQQIEDLQGQYTEKQRQTAMLERNSTIDDGASEQLKTSLDAAQAESLELKKELAFYKSVVTPEDTKRSLAIQTIQIKPDVDGTFQYKIMVSQRGRNDRIARGSIAVTIEGSQDGQASKLKLSSVSNEAKKQKKFGFKYFQNFEGAMKLPDTFQPEQIRVQVKPRSSRIDAIDEKFAWADLTADLTAGGEQNVGQ